MQQTTPFYFLEMFLLPANQVEELLLADEAILVLVNHGHQAGQPLPPHPLHHLQLDRVLEAEGLQPGEKGGPGQRTVE